MLEPLLSFLAYFVAFFLCCALLLVLVKEFKHQETGIRSALVFQDLWLLWLLTTAVIALLHVVPRALDLAVVGSVVGVFWLLCLDALLFRNFGVELEPTNVRRYFAEILDGFEDEVKQLGKSLTHTVFALLPLVGGAALAAVLWPQFAWLLRAPLLVYFAFRAQRLVGPRTMPVGLALALVGCFVVDRMWTGPVATSDVRTLAGAALLLPAAWLVASTPWAQRRTFLSSPTYLRNVLPIRSFDDDPDFEPRAEHRRLFETPGPVRTSGLHGTLRGANVLVVTLEGVAREHLSLFEDGSSELRPKTPFLAGLAARSVRSRHHFCISPQTTNAHRALYTSAYPDVENFAGLDALRRAGYRSLYLTPEETSWFGLADLLERAGFDAVFEHDDFVPHPLEPRRVSDYVLMEQGAQHLVEFAAAGPFFAHVQMMNTHKPYRVVDAERFTGVDSPDALVDDEISRYRACLEEMDWILDETFQHLEAAGLLDDLLVVVASDHGQAFGEFGYHGHSNAVIRPEIDVPFLMSHPRLDPGEVAHSSHLDVLPTVLDLLGIPWAPPDDAAAPVGESIFVGDRGTPSLLLYSEVVRAGAPSNFGLIDGERKIMVDQIYGQIYDMTWDDDIVATLDGEERKYFGALFHRLLADRGLLKS